MITTSVIPKEWADKSWPLITSPQCQGHDIVSSSNGSTVFTADASTYFYSTLTSPFSWLPTCITSTTFSFAP
ncbi:uncharacterized protein BDW43DRAFT_32290 [Aspergillus alliaceus]|uniref:uncharacterized protein n=1 Tax=Petromyces alliaceus TaxID=209559 RepID=UPI0012A56EC4|nr:uncharacterized protein BDW43DRAFT_32290 [Aspergillus alliaceus]KAB8235411.1 hypothetical protein BDW43DRAFT_32290 [Aspergillus alliaceus]